MIKNSAIETLQIEADSIVKLIDRIDDEFEAVQGVFSAIKTERNLKIHISIMILVIIAGIFLKISKLKYD